LWDSKGEKRSENIIIRLKQKKIHLLQINFLFPQKNEKEKKNMKPRQKQREQQCEKNIIYLFIWDIMKKWEKYNPRLKNQYIKTKIEKSSNSTRTIYVSHIIRDV